jgi:hypothetical protein
MRFKKFSQRIATIYEQRAVRDDHRIVKGRMIRKDHSTIYRAQDLRRQLDRSQHLLAEAHAQAGHPDEGFACLDEALASIYQTEERWWEAEEYRLKGQLLLKRSAVRKQPPAPNTQHPSGGIFVKRHCTVALKALRFPAQACTSAVNVCPSLMRLSTHCLARAESLISTMFNSDSHSCVGS